MEVRRFLSRGANGAHNVREFLVGEVTRVCLSGRYFAFLFPDYFYRH